MHTTYKQSYNNTTTQINAREYRGPGQSKMDNSETMITQGTEDEDKQNKNTTTYIIDIDKKNVFESKIKQAYIIILSPQCMSYAHC